MMNKLQKRDVIIIACLLVVAVALLIGQRMGNTKEGAKITITVDGTLYGTYSLEENQTIPITQEDGKTSNRVTIHNGMAYMEEADCPDHLCEKQGKIHQQSQSIVCLPNKVVVTVISGEESEYDSVAQ